MLGNLKRVAFIMGCDMWIWLAIAGVVGAIIGFVGIHYGFVFLEAILPKDIVWDIAFILFAVFLFWMISEAVSSGIKKSGILKELDDIKDKLGRG